MTRVGQTVTKQSIRSRWRNPVGAFLLTFLCAVLAGCAGPAASPNSATQEPTAPSTATTDQASPETAESRLICSDGRLLIGDLTAMNQEWQAGVAAATTKARRWQDDVRLTRLRVGCQLFESGFRWQAVFYSESAQTFYASDTGETEPAEVAPEDVPTLPTDSIDFGVLRRALAKSGFEDGDVISASIGVDVRFNTDKVRFGPADAPVDVLIYHVAIERNGETRDVFVDGATGDVYRFTSP
jgi:hypothetical protein